MWNQRATRLYLHCHKPQHKLHNKILVSPNLWDHPAPRLYFHCQNPLFPLVSFILNTINLSSPQPQLPPSKVYLRRYEHTLTVWIQPKMAHTFQISLLVDIWFHNVVSAITWKKSSKVTKRILPVPKFSVYTACSSGSRDDCFIKLQHGEQMKFPNFQRHASFKVIVVNQPGKMC